MYGFNFKAVKRLAAVEPLVDVVDAECVNTTPFLLKEIDMNTVKPEDQDFTTEFSLRVTRDDMVHAIVTYFDIDFSAGHKKIFFSTGPHAKYTHWKQTVFYLKEDLAVTKGDEIKGVYSMTRNAKNPRDYDIELKIDFEGKSGQEVNTEQFFRLR